MLSLHCGRKDRERIMKSVANLHGIKGVVWMWTPRFCERSPVEGTIGKENTSKPPPTPKTTAPVDMHY